ncbi:acid-sensing ion channel 1B-like isoform X1 [Strongylocentrotus purpuratus]|uniref:Uncharacterized protein n=1 Tax=Strongylocentrotus purpuratus TaxID=7668 RepID=A0A7M7PEX5_STRPU|nr:acid-sensing ion channel 1B-like isoform X1 [Strongylocentrotus purpuratus]
MMMNGNNAQTSPADDVSVELGMVSNEGVMFDKKHSRIHLVSSWWLALSRSAPEGIGVPGIKYILVSRESRCRRMGWLCILTLALTAFISLTAERAIYYSTFPLSVDISSNVTADGLTFPKVIICNFNSFVKSKTQARPAMDKLLRIYENTHYNSNETILLTQEELTHLRNVNTTQMFEELKHQKEDMFIRVVFAGVPVSLDDIIPVATTFGRCYQINDGQNGRQLLNSSVAGVSFGLSLILNTEQDEYYYNTYLKDSAGFSIQLLDQDETSDLHVRGFQVGPGTSADVSITAKQQNYAKPPYGGCGERKLQYFDKYSRIKCLLECMTHTVIEACGCRSPALPGNASVCDPITIGTCANAVFEEITSTHHAELCQCPMNCEERDFPVSVSTAKYPSAFRAGLLEKYISEGLLDNISFKSANLSVIEQNFVAVNIYFSDISTTVVTHRPAYTVSSFIADIGGSLGLFLGGSLLTIYEILDLCGHSFSRKH